MTGRHGGNIARLAAAAGRPAGEILDFSANLNPLGPPDWLRPLVSSRLSDLVHYPDPENAALTAAFAGAFGVPGDDVLMGNGSTELLYLLPSVLEKRRAVIPVPAYVDYAVAADLAGLPVEALPLQEERGFVPDFAAIERTLKGDEILLIGTPNNPTGLTVPAADLKALALRHPNTVVVADEAFADFTDEESLLDLERPENLIVLRSLTKFYAIPGLRLGAVVASPEIVGRLRRRIPPWSVNSLAQAVGAAALADRAYAEETRRFVQKRREELVAEIGAIPGLSVYPGKANFLLVRIDREGLTASELAQMCLDDGIAVRVCHNFAGLDGRFFRIAVRTQDENARLGHSLRKAMGIPVGPPSRRRTALIMLQGPAPTRARASWPPASAGSFCRRGSGSPLSRPRTCRSTHT